MRREDDPTERMYSLQQAVLGSRTGEDTARFHYPLSSRLSEAPSVETDSRETVVDTLNEVYSRFEKFAGKLTPNRDSTQRILTPEEQGLLTDFAILRASRLRAVGEDTEPAPYSDDARFVYLNELSTLQGAIVVEEGIRTDGMMRFLDLTNQELARLRAGSSVGERALAEDIDRHIELNSAQAQILTRNSVSFARLYPEADLQQARSEQEARSDVSGISFLKLPPLTEKKQIVTPLETGMTEDVVEEVTETSRGRLRLKKLLPWLIPAALLLGSGLFPYCKTTQDIPNAPVVGSVDSPRIIPNVIPLNTNEPDRLSPTVIPLPVEGIQAPPASDSNKGGDFNITSEYEVHILDKDESLSGMLGHEMARRLSEHLLRRETEQRGYVAADDDELLQVLKDTETRYPGLLQKVVELSLQKAREINPPNSIGIDGDTTKVRQFKTPILTNVLAEALGQYAQP